MNAAKSFTVFSTVLLSLTTSAFADNWGQWRGPHFNGSSTEKNLPAKWSKTENIAWSADLPGPSAATPVVWNDHVFVSSTDLRTKSLVALAYDRKSGKLLWQKEAGQGFGKDNRSNYSAPSPVTDGKRVIFFYGNGDLVAFDFSGKQLWARNIQRDFGEFAFQWTFSATPLLLGDKLYFQNLQRNEPAQGRGKPGAESFLLAINPDTGKDIWKVVRPSDAAAESREAYSTPIPFEHNGRKEILIVGGDMISGHDPESGKELWRWGTWNPNRIGHWRLVPSPIAGDGIILACAPKKEPIFAIKAGGNGTLTDAAIAWKSDNQSPISSDVPTPLFYEGDFFILNETRKTLSRVEPKTGKIKWTMDTPGNKKYEASPTGADGKIYLMNFIGDVVVVDAKKGEILSNTAMAESGEDNLRSSVVVSQGQLFIRTDKKLYCIGKK
jgi:outer membrane protein assembly factor BamB